ncbi:ribbon-helix-helix domain-containing protein [Acidovorax sp. BLS4]|uniref:ribbon-helix-helix domain-containing protein n=1 Tax=Acidovorax sp. BLS4 TaxID=3273430 RepID=UPI00355C6800
MARSIRTTVSVPEELYAALAKVAESSHVSTAWVIRDALRLYLGKQSGSEVALNRGPARTKLASKKVMNG